MRPDPQAGRAARPDLGQRPTLADGYLKVDTSSSPGNGIVGETIQFHGTADRYTLNGARAVATLYSTATTATTNPAVSLRTVGTQGGQAAAFTFDLARSVVYTRQGNPAWAGQERDGFSPIRSDDLFYGAKAGDVQPDWVDLTKVAIPQADEQQRLLVNLILEMNADRTPLPRFWYLPRGLEGGRGDDRRRPREQRHRRAGSTSSSPRAPPGCSVADWECIRGTSYIYPDTPLSERPGRELRGPGLRGRRCTSDTELPGLDAHLPGIDYATQLQAVRHQVHERARSRRPTGPTASPWSDWSTQADVELANGIRLDTNYYYWPPVLGPGPARVLHRLGHPDAVHQHAPGR